MFILRQYKVVATFEEETYQAIKKLNEKAMAVYKVDNNHNVNMKAALKKELL